MADRTTDDAKFAVAPSATTSLPVVDLPRESRDSGLVSAVWLQSIQEGSIAFDLGIGACDEGVRGLVQEFPDLIVIGGSVAPQGAGTSCTSQMVLHRVDVPTNRPVGTRPIVDAVSGLSMAFEPARADRSPPSSLPVTDQPTG